MPQIKLNNSQKDWEAAKETYRNEVEKIHKELSGKQKKVKPLSPTTHDEFAGHLLDVHQQWCRACSGCGPTSSTTTVSRSTCVMKVSTATQTDPTLQSASETRQEHSAVEKRGTSGIHFGVPNNASTPKTTSKSRVTLFSPIHPVQVVNEVRSKEGLQPLPSDDSDDDSEDSDSYGEDEEDGKEESTVTDKRDLPNMSLDEIVYQVDGVQEAKEDEDAIDGEEQSESRESDEQTARSFVSESRSRSLCRMRRSTTWLAVCVRGG